MKVPAKLLGFFALFILALILAFSPVDNTIVNLTSEKDLLKQLDNRSNYITADELAHLIIDKAPGYQVIDIRSAEDFKKYQIPGAIHIPVDKLFEAEAKEILNSDKTIILASNGNTKAAQAWLLLKEKGAKDIFVLEGGVNYWVNIFSNPQKPNDKSANDELFIYQFRKAAGPQMMGTLSVQESEKDDVAKPKRVFKKRSSKKKVDEGC